MADRSRAGIAAAGTHRLSRSGNGTTAGAAGDAGDRPGAFRRGGQFDAYQGLQPADRAMRREFCGYGRNGQAAPEEISALARWRTDVVADRKHGHTARARRLVRGAW